MHKDAGEPMNGNTEHVDAVGRSDGSTSDWNLSEIWLDDDDSESDFDDSWDELPEVYDGQDSDTYKILAILNREHLDDVFGETGSDSEDETPEFSQKFIESMCTMVADRFGQEAAERFMAQTNQGNVKKEVHHLPKTVSNAEKAMSQAEAELDGTAAAMSQTAQAQMQSRELKEKPLRSPSSGEKLLHTKSFFKNGLFSSWPRRVAVLSIIFVLSIGMYGMGVMATDLPDVSTDAENMTEYSKIGTLREIISHLDYTSCPDEIKSVYVPSVVAEGYEETDTEFLKKHVNIFYESSDRTQWYQYRQMTMDMNTFLDTEQSDGRDIEISGYPGFLITRDDNANLWWFDYNYAYHIEGTLSEDEIVSIAESVCE